MNSGNKLTLYNSHRKMDAKNQTSWIKFHILPLLAMRT